MPNGYYRPRKTSLCHHPGPEIHPEAHKYLPGPAESCFMALHDFILPTPACLPPACMRLFVCPRFTLSLSGTHALRSLLRSLRYVLPSEGVAVSVSRYCIVRGTSTPERAAETSCRIGAVHKPVCACLRINSSAREKTSKRTIQHVSRSFWPLQAGLTETAVCLSDRTNRQPP